MSDDGFLAMCNLRDLAQEALRLEPLAVNPGLDYEEDMWLYDNFADLARGVMDWTDHAVANADACNRSRKWSQSWKGYAWQLRAEITDLRQQLDQALGVWCLYEDKFKRQRDEIEHLRRGIEAYRASFGCYDPEGWGPVENCAACTWEQKEKASGEDDPSLLINILRNDE